MSVRNLMTNPVPTSTTGWVQFGGCEYRLTDRGIHVTNLVGGPGNGIEYKLLNLPTGDYVYGFYSSCPDHVNGDQLSLIKSTTNATYLCVVRRTETTRRRDERERLHPDAGKRMAYGAGVARIRRPA
ncbi:MAG: hypothetical protein U0N15_05130 [Bifidobacterium choerinum]